MAAPDKILKLVRKFEDNFEAYISGRYNEAQVRSDFINPFFEALGWDVRNEEGHAEAYRDVIHEESIEVGSGLKAPDMTFRIGGTRKFFVECKKPSVDLKEDAHPAYQLRRYGWSAKLPLSILTDFEEFAVYDCRIKPKRSDKSIIARREYFKYTEYAKRWDEIAAIFSKEAVLKGSFDRFAEKKKKRGTAEVDDAFLEEIERWRETLAKNIALRNKIPDRELNYAVQQTIDRIIFLRICEDRGIEPYQALGAVSNGAGVYDRLKQLFVKADQRYNSGLFHFRKEKGRDGAPDELTPRLKIDDKVLKAMIGSLYYPESPYEFSVLPSDILGQVYERFLGKVIRLTAGHHAKIEEKPEVRKAGGVYYTPTYIVDYIVKNTVGKLLEGKTPTKVAKFRILDPACGSGSFLIGAYQHLLDWHLKWYMDHGPAKHKKALYQVKKDEWRLTTAERKRILLGNIYGVDIDSQAVEVTKLSLLLKVLEGENKQTLDKQMKLFHERALPDLGNNIKCGNSLIGPDFYDGKQMSLLGDDDRRRINTFDWNAEFSETMKAGGFDAVIGNPPYIPTELMSEGERLYYQANYPQIERKYDSAAVFILSMLEKLQRHGRLGFISSITWQTGENYRQLRKHLFTQHGISMLINLPFDVFKGAYVDTGVYVLTACPNNSYFIYRYPKKETITQMDNVPLITVSTKLIAEPDYKIILEPGAHKILERSMRSATFDQLGNFTISTQGLAGNRFHTASSQMSADWYPFLEKGQARRYILEVNSRCFTDMKDKGSLKRFYEAEPKLLIRRVISRQDRLLVAYTDKKMVFKKDINPFVITQDIWNIYFMLGILNSTLISYLYLNTSAIATKDDFRQTTLAELRRLPIPRYRKSERNHDSIVAFARRMLDLHGKIAATKTPQSMVALQRQIAATDRQIDQLVYELYGLTEEEIGIVEESIK